MVNEILTFIDNTDAFVLILALGWGLLILYVLILLVRGILSFLQKRKYTKLFLGNRENKENIHDLLAEVSEYYKEKNAVGKAIREAVDYLENSMLKDYETAFEGIEKIMRGKKIKQMHEDAVAFYQKPKEENLDGSAISNSVDEQFKETEEAKEEQFTPTA